MKLFLNLASTQARQAGVRYAILAVALWLLGAVCVQTVQMIEVGALVPWASMMAGLSTLLVSLILMCCWATLSERSLRNVSRGH